MEQLERDSLMLVAASEIGADILISARDTLLSSRPLDTPATITVASPAEAIPMLGLYLRSRGEYFAPAYVAWQKEDWLKAIKRKDAALGALFDASARSAQALKVLRLLRNCIHDEGLDAVAVQTSDRTHETWIVLPESQATAITNSMIKLEPLANWGIHDGPDGSRYAEAGPLMETLLINSLAALNPAIERLGQILETITTTPDFGPASHINQTLLSRHTQWQVGLGDPWTHP